MSATEFKSVDFVINRFFVKLFKTTNVVIIQLCQIHFCFYYCWSSCLRRNELNNSTLTSVWLCGIL